MSMRTRVRWVYGAVALGWVVPLWAGSAAPLPAGSANGPKLRLSAASYFGGPGMESFSAVVCRPDGAIVACGNAWGPEFPAPSTVLGPEARRDLPLFSGGIPGDDWPYDMLPSAQHPNRTGFLVVYSADLKSATAVTRFGWGAATVDAAALTADGGLVTAGMAREGFQAVAREAAKVNRLPAGRGPRYGVASCQNIVMPGDVYVARWRDDLKGFAWVWILEKHVDPPARLFVAGDGRVVFDCRGLKSIGADGGALTEIATPPMETESEGRFLAGVSPRNGALLVAGWTLSASGDREWLGPLVEERGAAGELRDRYYDWRASLAFQPAIDRSAAAGVTQAEYLPDGQILIGAPARGGRSVLACNPCDITAPAGRRGVLPAADMAPESYQGALGVHLARFDPAHPENCAYKRWVGVSGRETSGEMTLDGLRALNGGQTAVWGMSGGTPPATATVAAVGTNAAVVANLKRKPGTPYLTVFSRDFSGLLWSGLLPRCRVSGVAASPRGVVAVSAFRKPWKTELFEPVAAPGAQQSFGGGYADGHILLLEVSE